MGYSNKYATFKEIRTETITVAATNNRGDSKKAKLFITLSRSDDFFENMKKFNDIREENERAASKIQEDARDSKNNWDWERKPTYTKLTLRLAVPSSPRADTATQEQPMRCKSKK